MKRLIGLLAVLVVFNAYSGVNLKNGNFYISYTDVIIPGSDRPLEVTRTYNSKSTDVGWFGFGWGNEFETNLKVSADGSVVIHENGAGALTRFTPKSQVNGKEAAQKIVAAMQKKNAISEANEKKLIKKLAQDAELRHTYARQFDVKAKIGVGAKLYSNQRGPQELIRTKDGFVRKSGDQKQTFFNRYGKLAKIKYKSGHIINFIPANRKDDKELKSIKDSLGKQIFLSWYTDGRVKEIYSSKDRKAAYSFKGKNLVSSTDLVGNHYVYDFDTNHNLTLVKYQDKTETKITYENKTQFVSSVTKRNGDVTSYNYGSNPKNPELHYWTEVKKAGPNGKPVTNRYEYEIRIKPDGQQYTYRIATKVNGLQTETIYSECCGLPIKISRGNKVTNFKYNENGLLMKKTLPGGKQISLDYNSACKKVSKVVNNKGWTKFDYDKKCNLAKAVNSKGKAVLLVYNHKSQITRMVDRDQKTKKQKVLTFTYNAMENRLRSRCKKSVKLVCSMITMVGLRKWIPNKAIRWHSR